MKPRRSGAGLLIAIVLTLTVACSTTQPAPHVRPVEIKIDEVRPCEMFSTTQQTELGLRSPVQRVFTVNGRPSPICTWTTSSGLGYNTQIIAADAQLAADEPGSVKLQVNGFEAIRRTVNELTGGAPTCQVTIDVADGSAIRVQARSIPREPLPTDKEMCRLATDAASKVMTTVVATAHT